MSELLSTLGLCKRAGMLAVGEEPVEAVARARDARVLLLASDAAAGTVRRCEHFAQAGQCLWLRTPFTKEELGRAVGRGVCAILAVTDIGFACAIVRRMAQDDPAAYGEAAQRLELKAKRAAERKSELAAHEKNLRRGKKRSRPAPEPSRAEASAKRAERPPRRPGGDTDRKRPGGPGGKSAGLKKPGGAKRAAGGPGQGFGGAGGRGRSGISGGSRKPGERAFSGSRTVAGKTAFHSRPVKKGKGSFRTGRDGSRGK